MFVCIFDFVFCVGATATSEPWPPHSWGF